MAQQVSASPIANLMARRVAVQKARDQIGLSSGGAPNGTMRQGKPIGPNEPGAPTPSQPAVTTPPAPAGGAPTDQGAAAATPSPGTPGLHPDTMPNLQGNNPAEMLELTTKLLNQVKSGGNPVAAAPAVVNAPPSTPPSINDVIQDIGGQNLSPEMQFMRMAGRAPSGREMSLYYATRTLAQQLGRNPTKNELLQYVTSGQQQQPASGAPVIGAQQ